MRIQDAYVADQAAVELKKTNRGEAVPEEGSARSEAGRATAESDGVQLSALSTRLLELAKGVVPGRAERIAELSASVRNGTYRVEPAEISRKLIDSALKGLV